MARGSIYDFLHKQKCAFKLQTLLKVALDVAKGMCYLHQNNIIHRDLKTANLLMDEHGVRFVFPLPTLSVVFTFFLCKRFFSTWSNWLEGSKTLDNFVQLVKVADFGVARVQIESGVMTAETGTYRWMAPEVRVPYICFWSLCETCCISLWWAGSPLFYLSYFWQYTLRNPGHWAQTLQSQSRCVQLRNSALGTFDWRCKSLLLWAFHAYGRY